jgi:hypothetical protein
VLLQDPVAAPSGIPIPDLKPQIPEILKEVCEFSLDVFEHRFSSQGSS